MTDYYTRNYRIENGKLYIFDMARKREYYVIKISDKNNIQVGMVGSPLVQADVFVEAMTRYAEEKGNTKKQKEYAVSVSNDVLHFKSKEEALEYIANDDANVTWEMWEN